jgi:hypothetical protein
MMRKRKIWAEGSFAALKREHNLSAIRKRGIRAATEECLLSALALNLKRMVKSSFPDPRKKNHTHFYLFRRSFWLKSHVIENQFQTLVA